MKKQLILLVTLLTTTFAPVAAQVVLNFDAGQPTQTADDSYYATYLKEHVYATDDGYYAQLLQNPFFEQTVADNATTAIALQPMNSGTPVRDNYFGMATWATSADFDNVTLTTLDGTTVYSDEFTKVGNEWNQNGGTWEVADGVLRQTDTGNLGDLNVCYKRTGHEGILSLDATKRSGAEGFLIAFSYIDNENYCWWNIGGWNNSQHAIEQCVNGVKTTLTTAAGSIVTGQTYRLKVKMEGEHVLCYIDDRLIHDITLQNTSTLYGSAAVSDDGNRVWVRVANPTASQQNVVVRLKDADVQGAALIRKSVSQAFTPDLLANLTVGTTSSTSLTPVMDDAVRFDARARSLNTLELTVTDVPIATHIEETTMDQVQGTNAPAQTAIYDLAGRRMAENYESCIKNSALVKGLYIVNGKKVLIR